MGEAAVVNGKELRGFVTWLLAGRDKDSPSHDAMQPHLQELADWAGSHEEASQTEIDAAVERCNAQLRIIEQAHYVDGWRRLVGKEDADEHH